MSELNEIAFFTELLEATGKEFSKSPVKILQGKKNVKWNYSICDTPILKGKGIIFGLNWGGKENHEPQKNYPTADKERNWNFMNQSRRYFEKYLKVKSMNEVNYSNLCFFRSPKVSDLSPKDWGLAVPLFRKYVEYIEPEWTLLLGKTGVEILNKAGHLEVTRIETQTNKKRVFGYSGIIFNKYPFFCVPHPQTKISTEARNKIWSELFAKENRPS